LRVIRSWSKSVFAALTSSVAIAMAGCSAGGSIPSVVGVPTSDVVLSRLHGPRFTVVKQQPPAPMQIAYLMTDGSILAQSYSSWNEWFDYVPDPKGDYSDGTWTQVGSLQAGYAPDANASALMADGRLVIIGGEYNQGGPYDLQLVNLGAVYDPKTATWTPLGHPNHPKHWRWIGDSPSSVLPNGRYLLGDKLHTWDAYLDPKSLRWHEVGDAGKADWNAEEGWTLLPDGQILTADVLDAPNSERYNPSTGTWTSAGSTVVDLRSPSPFHYCLTYGPKPKDCYLPPGEIGPAVLRPDGTVFATGSGTGPSGTGDGHTAIYKISGRSGTWTAGPDFPNDDNAGDSWAMLAPSGDVLVIGVSGALYDFNGSTFTQVGYAGGVPILLPTGQILMLGTTATIYTPTGKPKASWAPHIKTFPSSLTPGSTYKISGTQFNGLSQAMAYGDEFQNATNYPLVRITNTKTGDVFYARTHDHSSMGVATGSLIVSTHFDVPAKIDSGASRLQVVANGIASPAVSVTVK
jgi:hypothetical protein